VTQTGGAPAKVAPSRGAVDCHAHVIDPARFPFPPDAGGYRPLPHEAGTAGEYLATLDAHGVTHALLVQPSGYGYDNRAMLDAIARAPGRLRGIAVVPLGASDADLDALARGGVVGVRFNLSYGDPGVLGTPAAQDLLRRVAARDWVLQVHTEGDTLAAVAPALLASGCRVVVDHMARPDPRRGLDQPSFRALLDLGRGGRAAVKLSAPERYSREPSPHADLDPFVAALLQVFTPARCVWGSDWPHIQLAPRPDYAGRLACLDRWLPDPRDRRAVLWETPARVFGFGPS
jgi:predicted TIM-barrel fold metal-dependent hydrolase